MMQETDKAYCAALVDAIGFFYVKKTKNAKGNISLSLIFNLLSLKKEVIDRFYEFFPFGNYYKRIENKKNASYTKRMVRLSIQKIKDLEYIYENLNKYVLVRKEQFELVNYWLTECIWAGKGPGNDLPESIIKKRLYVLDELKEINSIQKDPLNQEQEE